MEDKIEVAINARHRKIFQKFVAELSWWIIIIVSSQICQQFSTHFTKLFKKLKGW